MKEFSEALEKLGVECKLVKDSDYSRGFPSKKISDWFNGDRKFKELIRNNIEAIIDDTDENLSSKIKKMNLIGSPFQIILGKQSEGDLIEFKITGQESKKIKLEKIIQLIKKEKLEN